jgi:hypothetical protein
MKIEAVNESLMMSFASDNSSSPNVGSNKNKAE